MEIILRKASVIGRQCFSVYEMPNKKRQTQALNPKDYDALAEPGAGEPLGKPNPDARWLFSYETPLFDTPSGFQEVGDIWEKRPGFYQIKIVETGGGKEQFLGIDCSKCKVTGELPNITVEGLEGISIIDGTLVK